MHHDKIHNEVLGKVIFSQASVILSTRWGWGWWFAFPACITGHMTGGFFIQGGLHRSGVGGFFGKKPQVCLQQGCADPPSPEIQRDTTVNKRAVRIRLECFLILNLIQLSSISILFSLETIQKSQFCHFCVLLENSNTLGEPLSTL